MTRDQILYWTKRMKLNGWHLATHLTILDRKNSYHRMIGRLHFVKPRRKET